MSAADLEGIDPATPVLIGVGAAMDRGDDPTTSPEAVELMHQAVGIALADTGLVDAAQVRLIDGVTAVGAMSSMTSYSNPARLVADRLGLPDSVFTLRADAGTLQQQVFNWAAEEIHGGRDAVIVVGGEAKYRDLQAAIRGVELPPVTGAAGPEVAPPDLIWSAGRGILSEPEFDLKLYDAVAHYALMEFSLARSLDRPLVEHMGAVAELMARQSSVATTNPDAWHRDLFEPSDFGADAPGNRMVSSPYGKWHNSQWNVNQSAALVFCRAERAAALGVPRDKWIFQRGGAVSNAMLPVSQRTRLHEAPWINATADAALDMANLQVEELGPVELYSCFPVAIQMQAEAIGIDLSTTVPTITGGMTFAGGPFNSWVLHAVVAMAQRLRTGPHPHGMVTSISGMVTKHATAILSTEPDGGGLRTADVSDAVAAQMDRDRVLVVGAAEVDAGTEAELVAATVIHDRSGPQRAIALARLPGSAGRVLAESTDGGVMDRLVTAPDEISRIVIRDGVFDLAPADDPTAARL